MLLIARRPPLSSISSDQARPAVAPKDHDHRERGGELRSLAVHRDWLQFDCASGCKKAIGKRAPPYEVAHSLTVSVPTLYRLGAGFFTDVKGLLSFH
jgi:hypothetical protein